MFLIDKDAERLMQKKKREILTELEEAKIRILQELSGVDKITLTRLRSLIAKYDDIEFNVNNKVENMETLVESIKNQATKTAFVSLSDSLTTSVIQSLINSGRINTLYIDTDITLSEPLHIPSGFNVVGDGGTIYCVGGEAFKVYGSTIGSSYECTNWTTLSEYFSNYELRFENGGASFEAGEDVFLKGSQNVVSRSAFTSNTLREKYYLCEGTTYMKNAFAGMLCKVKSVGGSAENPITHAVRLDTPFSWYYGKPSIIKVNVAEKVVFDGVRIVNESAEINRTGVIEFMYARNCEVKNCEIISNNGTLISTKFSRDIHIHNNSLNITNYAFTDHAENNIIRVQSTTDTIIERNIISGGTQCVDITYAMDGTVSHNIVVKNNSIYALETGITTHPGTFRCIIENNFIETQRKGIAIRGHYHTVSGNKCYYTANDDNGSSGYGVGIIEGCSRFNKVIGNTFRGFAWGLYIHEDNLDGRDNSFPASLNLDVTGNSFEDCTRVIYIRCTPDSTNTICKINLNFKNNTIYGDANKTDTDYFILTETARGTNKLSCIFIVDNSFTNFAKLNEFDISTATNYIVLTNNIIQASTYNKGNISSATLTGKEENNTTIGTVNNSSQLGGM